MTNIHFIKNLVQTAENNIIAVLKLLSEDCTIPFIARYRKDQTGNLDEVAIEQIAKSSKQYEEILKRKQAVLKSIEEQNQLSPDLKLKLDKSFDLQEIEDLYLPYKKKKRTRADIARENGLEPLAQIMMSQGKENVDTIAEDYLNENIPHKNAALQGARDIVAEQINENIAVRKSLRRLFQQKALIETKVIKKKAEEETAQKFKQYFDWSENLTKAPSHRLLAMLRAENEGFIKLKIDVDEDSEDEVYDLIAKFVIINHSSPSIMHIQLSIEDAYKRLLQPSIANEVLQNAKLKADLTAIGVFSSNLSQLLLAPPLGEKRILAIDPGFRSGCKIVCLDQNGDLLYNETVYPHASQSRTDSGNATMAMKKIKSMVNAYNIEAIAIGNGTASRETEFFIKKIGFDKPLQVFVVSEAGASVYSASKIARDEFPNYDVTVRGAISIGRRLSDPLAELVKIDPKAIGVGQYQHDVDQTKLQEELDATVIRCVNAVGININTASKQLLSYVSGIGEKLAENIVQFRTENGPFSDRKQLKKVPRLGEKAFQQAAAFIRIKDGKNALDNSAVHPESYPIVEKMAKDLKFSVVDLIGNKEKVAQIKPENYITSEIGLLTLKDIIKELEKPGLDPRKAAKIFEFDPTVKIIKDLKAGMILPGIVNNITAFGCFVDIGTKESGLVHISQLKEGFVSDVNEVVKLHQHVRVKVVEVDEDRKRIQLTMVV